MARFDNATIILSEDGGMHFNVHDRQRRAIAHKRFQPAQNLPLRDWLTKSANWLPFDEPDYSWVKIAYSHQTGKITLNITGQTLDFDPNKDEDLARLVRRLKALAPLPSSEPVQETLPELPIPTDDQMARRQIMANIGIPDGVKGYKAPKRRYQQPAVSADTTRKVVKDIMKDLFDLDL